MKLSRVICICGLILLCGACERHHIKELAGIEEESHGSGSHHEAAGTETPIDAEHHESGPAPKYFPDGRK
jgi:hypothetical protein